MKDIQGIQRGKCNSCECEEYMAPSKPGLLRCEYCDHTPREHVKIIQLKECTKCGKEECEKYVSEDPNRYTDCEYCGCSANDHAGSEELRKHSRPANQQFGGGVMPQGGGAMPQGGGIPPQQAAGFQPRMNAYGQPLQQPSHGVCKSPGCNYPKRQEGNKIHDFCSRTCAKKYTDAQSSFHQQKVAAAQAAQQGGPPPHAPGQQGPSGGVALVQQRTTISKDPFGGPTQVTRTTVVATDKRGGPSGGMQNPGGLNPIGGGSPGGNLCSKCHVNPANKGRGWCQQCYIQSNP